MIGQKMKYASKENLTYEEFMAIKSDFTAFDFNMTIKGQATQLIFA